MGRWTTAAVVVAVLVCIGAMGQIVKDTPRFRDPKAMARILDERSEAAVEVLQTILTQEQINTLEAALFEAVDPAEQLRQVEAAKYNLLRAGLETTDPTVVAVEAKRAELATAAEQEDTRREGELVDVEAR